MTGAASQSTDSFLLAGAIIEEADLGGILMAVLVDNADAILILDDQGTILAANPAAEQLFGRPVDHLVGTPLGRPVTTGVRYELEILASGGIRFAELHSRTTTWRGLPARVVTLRDVTDRRRALDSLRDFVSMTAHEVATPLTSIAGFAETLLHNWHRIDDGRREEFLAIIHRQASRVSAISSDLLALSQLDAASIELRRQPVVVAEVVEELVQEGMLGDLDVEVKMAQDVTVHADPAHVATILGNFLSNARKYGRAPVVVQARRRGLPKGATIRISVSDSGDGVPEAFVPHLFERFARVRQGLEQRGEGTGLGLSLSAGLAELNGGAVAYQPTKGGGATFSVALPEHAPA